MERTLIGGALALFYMAALDIFWPKPFQLLPLYTLVHTLALNREESQVTEYEGFMKRWGVCPISLRRIICLMSTHSGGGAAALFGISGSFGYEWGRIPMVVGERTVGEAGSCGWLGMLEGRVWGRGREGWFQK